MYQPRHHPLAPVFPGGSGGSSVNNNNGLTCRLPEEEEEEEEAAEAFSFYENNKNSIGSLSSSSSPSSCSDSGIIASSCPDLAVMLERQTTNKDRGHTWVKGVARGGPNTPSSGSVWAGGGVHGT